MNDPLIEKLLGLPEFEVTDYKQNEHDAGFYVQTTQRPSYCLACGVIDSKLTIYKTRKQTVRDFSIQSKRTALIISRKYYHCDLCGGRFAEPLLSVGEGERITKRLRQEIAMLAAYVPFVDLENEYQISDTHYPQSVFIACTGVAKTP